MVLTMMMMSGSHMSSTVISFRPIVVHHRHLRRHSRGVVSSSWNLLANNKKKNNQQGLHFRNHKLNALRFSSSVSFPLGLSLRINHADASSSNAKQQPQQSRNFTTTNASTKDESSRVYIAVGSNLGNRFENIDHAIRLLTDPAFLGNTTRTNTTTVTRLRHTSMLHETAPMYVTDQPSFLNGVIEIKTNLSPLDLLDRLKQVESQMGRDLNGVRNGPRPVDLDILFYLEHQMTNLVKEADSDAKDVEQEINLVMDTPRLVIPHPRIAEREFVLAPLCEVVGLSSSDLQGDLLHPVLGKTTKQLFQELLQQQQQNGRDNDNTQTAAAEEKRVVVLPLPRGRMLYLNETVVMGILNVTPDSFSDGGKWNASLELAVQHALQMEQQGAGIIDIGGESTRPGAQEIAIQEELDRTIPVIERIRNVSDIPISIDTRHAVVAKAAVDAGADIVNDVSGGMFDQDMLSTVAHLRVPMVLMHMRGTPETMQVYASDYSDKGVVHDVTQALRERCAAAEAAGIPRWMQIVDPGIGFAKDLQGNLSLLKNLNTIRSSMGMASTPILLGTSRKGFIGKLTGIDNPEERDFGSVASSVAAICLGKDSEVINVCNILRVHNVKGTKEAALVVDGIRQAS